ncbi:hypothetical protein DFH09DRAFT_861051, partial [Mycena vulgaris]
AYVHSKGFIWAEAHFRNILVTEDLHIDLADFAYSIMNLSGYHYFMTMLPPVFACPDGFYGKPPIVDMFGFRIVFFALVGDR